MPQPPPAARAAAKTAASAAAAATRVAARTTPRPSPGSSSSSSTTSKTETAQKTKRIIITLAFAAVISTGTIYGAGLKTQQEWKAEKQKVQEATVDDKVAMLERQKHDLMRQKREIDAKLGELRARMRAGAEGAGAGSSADGGR
ncbi:hypothetical protein C8A01DRAFT_47759 [Parachaetomium inaequale]|uniref:Uncharacterized protein n=1 Tax=Parachaetomium inaequale TaxID=2588326 RepID=A0AAN6PCZ2_9PEZI|nr:hypothetical protein C8A01DRAFT_47759 [Parachaetomium inaequale]